MIVEEMIKEISILLSEGWGGEGRNKPRKKKKRGRPKKKKDVVNRSEMYKHMVDAIYKSIKKTGYKTRGTPETAAQMIARGQMIKHGYAKRRSKAGGIPDRRKIKLTAKGKKRSRKHAGEPRSVRLKKDRLFKKIVKKSQKESIEA